MNHAGLSYDLQRCRKLLAQLNDYLDGELPADLCAELEYHLAGCPDCQVVLDTLAQTVRILHHLDEAPPPALPADLEARLLARLRSG
ncbi:MAG: anti-sigma factor family protein [Chloroflexaceae bacterium]